ncbi:hypothetical protein M231_04242 [Tremella mesenterica]|uniref:UAS domain-containing protein n=1 Tax=Tremella mesenterica TaxID=5217 RepID=A0A4V1M3Y4_TREME|nr:hypothetical protein M231_04242 [Tremella mesenterica]
MSYTPAQRESLEQLWAITASDTGPARERDERLLRESGWDVQRTVDFIFSMGSTTSGRPAGPSRPPPPSFEPFEIDDRITNINIPRGARRLSGSRSQGGSASTQTGLGLWGLITWPLTTLASLVGGVWYFFIRTFIPLSFLPRLPRFLRPPSSRSRPSKPAPQDPITTSLAFIKDLETLTSCSVASGTLPSFRTISYRDFVTEVRMQGKVGLVILVSGEHEDDEEFKKDVLCDGELIKTLKENGIMVWGADIRSREGYQVAQTLQATTYPTLTFLSLLPGGPSSSAPRLSILSTLAGPPSTTTSASSIIQALTTSILPRVSAFLSRRRREHLALEEARHLREEQDRNFREAEKRDRDRLLTRRQAQETERLRIEREARLEKEAEQAKVNRTIWRRYARKHLLPTSSGPIRVAFRTPLGAERHMRQFETSDSTEALFIFAETLLIPSDQREEDDPDSPPEGFIPPQDFRIVTNYPRKEVERTSVGGKIAWEAVKEAGGALFAEKIEEGHWAEEELKALRGEESDEEEADD